MMATTTDVGMDMGTRETSFPWWLVLLEGIFAAIFGLLLLIAPGGTLLFMVQVLGFYLFIEGILRIVGIFAGIVVLNHPLLSTIAIPTYLAYVVAFLAIFEGVGGLIHAFQGGGWSAGILSILVMISGLILLFNPLIGVVALPFVLGGFMLVGGIAAIVASFRLRSGPDATAMT